MADAHLTEEESTNLVRYFTCLRQPDWADKANKEIEDIGERCRSISDLEQYRAEILGYERESIFGKTAEEIERNAREHIKECFYCFTRYELAVKKEAMITMAGHRGSMTALELPLTSKGLSELMRDAIKREDVLGVLTQEK